MRFLSSILLLITISCKNNAQKLIDIEASMKPNSGYEIESKSTVELDMTIPGNDFMEKMMKQKSGGKNPVTTTETTYQINLGNTHASESNFESIITKFETKTEPNMTSSNSISLANSYSYGKISNGFIKIDSINFMGGNDTNYFPLFRGLLEMAIKSQYLSKKRLKINDTFSDISILSYPIQPIGTIDIQSIRIYKLIDIDDEKAIIAYQHKFVSPGKKAAAENFIDAYGEATGEIEYHIRDKMIMKQENTQVMTQVIENPAYSIVQKMTTKSETNIRKTR